MNPNVFQIKAKTKFLSRDDKCLSFCHGQVFYVLSSNTEKGCYFVTVGSIPNPTDKLCSSILQVSSQWIRANESV